MLLVMMLSVLYLFFWDFFVGMSFDAEFVCAS